MESHRHQNPSRTSPDAAQVSDEIGACRASTGEAWGDHVVSVPANGDMSRDCRESLAVGTSDEVQQPCDDEAALTAYTDNTVHHCRSPALNHH